MRRVGTLLLESGGDSKFPAWEMCQSLEAHTSTQTREEAALSRWRVQEGRPWGSPLM